MTNENLDFLTGLPIIYFAQALQNPPTRIASIATSCVCQRGLATCPFGWWKVLFSFFSCSTSRSTRVLINTSLKQLKTSPERPHNGPTVMGNRFVVVNAHHILFCQTGCWSPFKQFWTIWCQEFDRACHARFNKNSFSIPTIIPHLHHNFETRISNVYQNPMSSISIQPTFNQHDLKPTLEQLHNDIRMVSNWWEFDLQMSNKSWFRSKDRAKHETVPSTFFVDDKQRWHRHLYLRVHIQATATNAPSRATTTQTYLLLITYSCTTSAPGARNQI